MRKASIAILFAILLGASSASAQTDPDRLFSEGLALMEDGKFGDALSKLEDAQRRDPGIGTEFNIALCYEKLGKTATAWRHYANVERLAHASGKAQREENAHAKLEELRPQLSILVLTAAKAEGVTVRVDGAVVPIAEWSMVPVDGGEHRIDAEAKDRKPWNTTVEAPAAGASMNVEIPPLDPIERQKVVITNETTSGRRTLGLVLGGVGAAGLVAATVTGILLLHDKSSADDGCGADKKSCSAAAFDDANQGKTLLPLNLASWVIAVAGLGIGTYLVLTSGKKAPQAASYSPYFRINL